MTSLPRRPLALVSQLAVSHNLADHPEVALSVLRGGPPMTFGRNSVAVGLADDWSEYPVVAHQPRLWSLDSDADGVADLIGRPCEPARTNEWTKSRDLSNAAWTKTGITVATDTTKGPDQIALAYKMQEDTSTGVHSVGRNIGGSPTNNIRATYSFAAKAAERTWLAIVTVDKAGTGRISYVNLATGAVGTTVSQHAITVKRRVGGWWRISVAYDVVTGGSTPSCTVRIATGDGTSSYTGTSGSGIYVTELQCETDADYPTSFILTDTGTVTRAADLVSGLLDVALPDQFTAYSRFRRPDYSDLSGTLNYGAAYLWSFGSAQPLFGLHIPPSSRTLQSSLDTTSPDFPAISNIPAAAIIEVCSQFRKILAGCEIRHELNDGAGFTAWGSAHVPIADVGGTRTFYIGDRTGSGFCPGTEILATRVALGELLTLDEMAGRR